VLIPRGDTASLVTHLADVLHRPSSSGAASVVDLLSDQDGDTSRPSTSRELRVLDACTGTGCMSLLLSHLLENDDIRVRTLGVDISPRAVALSRINARRILHRHTNSCFRAVRADVLEDKEASSQRGSVGAAPSVSKVLHEEDLSQVDILLSNPPYISPHGYSHSTTRSVRNFEPKLALVPPRIATPAVLQSDRAQGDRFYPRLLDLAHRVRAKVVLFEVADLDQAVRVASAARASGLWVTVEIWRDQPGGGESESVHGFKVRGSGHGRGVFLSSMATRK
jgi:methylase of polypeptide subunit release factors